MARRTGDSGSPAPTTTPARALHTRGRRTRRRLLDAGTTVFARRGYHAARVDDIVHEARTSHGTFYLYFSSKEDLFAALAGEVVEEVTDVAASLAPHEPGEAGRRTLREWVDRVCDLYVRRGPVIRAWTEAEIGPSEFGRLGDDALGALTSALAARVREADVDGAEPAVAALALVAMVDRLNYLSLTRQAPLERDVVAKTLTEVIDAVLRG